MDEKELEKVMEEFRNLLHFPDHGTLDQLLFRLLKFRGKYGGNVVIALADRDGFPYDQSSEDEDAVIGEDTGGLHCGNPVVAYWKGFEEEEDYGKDPNLGPFVLFIYN